MKTTVSYLLVFYLIKVREMVNYIFATQAMPMSSSLRRELKTLKTATVVFHLLRFGQSSHMRFKAMSNKGSIPIFPKTCKYFEKG